MLSKTFAVHTLTVAILATVVSIAHAKGFGALVISTGTQNAFACKIPPEQAIQPLILREIFPNVIYKTPGRDEGSAQLFAPIRNIAEPLARLGTRCLLQVNLIPSSERRGKLRTGSAGDTDSCGAFALWVESLAKEDALRFDREKHHRSPVSLVSGALSGNLTIRPIAFYVGALRDAGIIRLSDNDAVDSWMLRRVVDYNNVPAQLTSVAAQNLVLYSVLAKLTVSIAVGKPREAINEAKLLFKLYLDNARADGSFPTETRRGISALKYSNMATGGLVMLAEISELAGVNLYNYSSSAGVDIHRAVGFVAKAILDESIISGYANENYAPTDKAVGDGQARYFMRDHLGWVSLYMKRYPMHANAKLLSEIIEKQHTLSNGHYDEILGAIDGCAW
jgi:hypothetical protein